MKTRYKVVAMSGVLVALAAVLAHLVQGHTIAVLTPRGTVARQELQLMIVATLLMLVVVIPVFVMTFMISWKYRASNTKARYTPEWDHNTLVEWVWWGLPCLIIGALAWITWTSSHSLDPYKPLVSSVKPITVEVVALPWKWLFIYPDQHIATVNMVEFPQQTPVNFVITGDAPMNSFWIPQLGGQVYAMAGMTTQLHLMADGAGSYAGSSANLSGNGFADMRFTAKSVTASDFAAWVKQTQASPRSLNATTYAELAKPSTGDAPAYYGATQPTLYDTVVMKYMMPMTLPSASGTGAAN